MLPSTESAPLLEKEAVRELIQTTAALLDHEQFDEWIELFARGSEYEILAFSTELAVMMTWWKSSREELEKLLHDIPRQVRDNGRRLHIVTPMAIRLSNDRGSAQSHFIIVRTSLEGKSTVYAAGRYADSVVKTQGKWVYEKHQVILDTRMLEPLTHVPL